MSRELTTSDRKLSSQDRARFRQYLENHETSTFRDYSLAALDDLERLLEDLEKVEIDGLPEVSRLLAENVRLREEKER